MFLKVREANKKDSKTLNYNSIKIRNSEIFNKEGFSLGIEYDNELINIKSRSVKCV